MYIFHGISQEIKKALRYKGKRISTKRNFCYANGVWCASNHFFWQYCLGTVKCFAEMWTLIWKVVPVRKPLDH